MAKGVTFDRDSAVLVARATRRVLGMPYGDMPENTPHRARGSTPYSGYSGPWAVIDSSTTDDSDPPVPIPQVTIKAQDITGGYPCVSRVIAGMATVIHGTDSDVAITVDGEVYADITVTGETYSIAFANASDLPAQSDEHCYVSLARVEFKDGAITNITQVKTSDIEIAGRVV